MWTGHLSLLDMMQAAKEGFRDLTLESGEQ